MQALVNLLFKRQPDVVMLPAHVDSHWLPYIRKLTAELLRHLQHEDLVENEEGYAFYHQHLADILVTEMYRLTGRLVHKAHMLELQKACRVRSDYLEKFSKGLQIIEDRLNTGHSLHTGYTLDPSKF